MGIGQNRPLSISLICVINLFSHPSVAEDGSLYFHAGAVDYSELNIYFAKVAGNGFTDAVKLPDVINIGNLQNTPHIAPDASYLLFEATPDLYISYKDSNEQWLPAKPLNEKINRNGKGNPYITPDQNYLFYVAGAEENPDKNWMTYWIHTKNIIFPTR